MYTFNVRMAYQNTSSDLSAATTSPWAYNIAVALVILFVGIVIGRIVKIVLRSVFAEIEIDYLVRKATKRRYKIKNMVSTAAEYSIYSASLIVSLRVLGIASDVVIVILLLAAGVLSASVVLNIKDFFPNIAARSKINKKLLLSGKNVKIGNTSGIVKKVSFTGVFLKTGSGDTIFFPNSSIVKEGIKRSRPNMGGRKNDKRIPQKSKRKD